MLCFVLLCSYIIILNTVGPTQKWPPFADDILKFIVLYEDCWIMIQIPVKYVSKVKLIAIIGSDNGLMPILVKDALVSVWETISTLE